MSSKNELPAYWKRIGYVAIENGAGGMDRYGGNIDALDFKFDGKFCGDICPKFTVSILGLSQETINDLTVWNPADAVTRKRRIEVYAGYEKDGINTPIMSGFIFSAIPTNPPEMWMNFSCLMSFASTKISDMNKVEKGISLKDVLNTIAKEIGVGSRWDSKKVDGNKKVDFEFSGTPQQMCDRLAYGYGVVVHSESDALIVTDRRGYTNEVKNPSSLNTDTGMLAIGNISLKGATVTRRLDTRVGMFSWVNITSKVMPSANGNYFVISKRYVGHFRGNEWYTELEMIRKQSK